MNLNVKIQGRRSILFTKLEGLACLEDAQLIFLIFQTFVCKFGLVRRGSREITYRQMYGKLEKLTERLLAKLHPSNMVNTIYLVFECCDSQTECNSTLEKVFCHRIPIQAP